MSILSDRDIQTWMSSGGLDIYPVQHGAIQPASIELHLGEEFKIMQHQQEGVDLLDPQAEYSLCHTVDGKIRMDSGNFLLAHTVEAVKIPNGLVGRVEGKSSLGRFGLAVHITAGFIDPGFSGQITLELFNHSPNSLYLTPGMKIAQICFMRLHSHSAGLYGDARYGSHYQGQYGAREGSSLK